MGLGKKIKAVRIAEELSQLDFSQLTDISIDSLRSYENDRRTVNEINMIKVTKHERFKKYAYWLTTDETLPESGQIAPDFSILLELGIVEKSTDDKKSA
ncbi:helix-turn-helix transcriptional regulator [Vibrio sp. YMD68]|uniref:helix-turn-helix transcriptional regulator n=1 Tax=Vibrio sp. YMD68 TaxID=3042300 RepID=UPI00249CC20F|nr:helix-turn-helix transcriptional regulator [Vibrio sp. YMD68]WGW00330.1 helix-turn-helix transcriptional regulator [Vibrio sp. YMD68]WGW00989.1 helix-turn-helix transcriptional regulator [Vibrio sp. YMD68]